MVYSVTTAPHGHIAFEIDYGNIDAFRRKHKERFKAEHGISLTYLPFVCRAVVEALRAFARLNAAIDGTTLVVRKAINLGIAVDLDHRGLMVPVIENADRYYGSGLAKSIAELAAKARTGKTKPEDLQDETFTVTNPGPSGRS